MPNQIIMKFIYKNIFFFIVFAFALSANAQNSFYNIDSVQTIEIYFEQANWDYQMDTAKYGQEEYTLAKWVKVNGVQYDSVGVKYKGNSSYDSTYTKNPLHIALDEFREQSHNGVTDIKLGNAYADPSMIREVLGYEILKNYMHCPSANFAKVYINGVYVGVYSSAENIDKSFCSNHFNSSKNTFVKCNPTVIPTAKVKSNLKYISTDSSAYATYYELKSDQGWNELINLCDTITNTPSAIGNIMDIDRVLWMLAFNNTFVNLDSYTGAFAQNYYLYRDKTKHFNPIIWDLNMAFGGFPNVGYSNTSLGALDIATLQKLPTNIHSTDAYWPLIKGIMSNAQYKRKYIAHMKTMLNEFVTNNTYKTLIDSLQNIVSTAVQADTNKFFTDNDFTNATSNNIAFTSYSIPGITTLMDARATYLLATSEFTATEPVITNITTSTEYPVLNTSIGIKATVSNASLVYLNYRTDDDLKFTTIQMYDDGLHNDSLASDGIYGNSFIIDNNIAQYYLYAENTSAGKFSPARAEHEFYSIKAYTQELSAGEVVINEFLASNKGINYDNEGKYEDWIELYNNTDKDINLFGHYISDSKANLTKYTFKENSIITAKGFLTLWADEDSSTATAQHCNFKLSGSGEAIYLTNSNQTIVDSIIFGAQTSDVSMGRCVDGIGKFYSLIIPTYNKANFCSTVGIEDETTISSKIYPNPANNVLNISNSSNNLSTVNIYNVIGNLIYSNSFNNSNISIDTSNWNNGVYILKMNNSTSKIIIQH